MTVERVLFIGGPLRGSRNVDTDKLLVLAEDADPTFMPSGTSAGRMVYSQRAFRLRDQKGVTHKRIIYAPRNWTDLEVFDVLLSGYRP